MEKPVPGKNRVFRDKEIVGLYIFEIGILSLVLLLGLIRGEWLPNLILFLAILCFLFLGWPLTAEITEVGDVVFKGPIRKVKLRPQTLVRVKGSGLRDYRAHLILCNKRGLPIGYRHRKYDDAPHLAKAVMRLINESPHVHADKDAVKSLEQVAKRAK